MIPEVLAEYLAGLMGRSTDGESVETLMLDVAMYVVWLEQGRLDCRVQHRERERLADLQRQSRAAGEPITGDLAAEVTVLQMLGSATVFSEEEDYAVALQWAVRAYRAGQAAEPQSDEYAAGPV